MSSSSDLLRTSPTNNYHSIAERPPRPERSCSPLTTNDLARRLRAAITPPRMRREKHTDFETRPRSATASPSLGLTTSSELIGEMPDRKLTASCGDLGRLENIFEPRLAPYTPPLRMRRGLSLEDRSPSLRGLSDEEIEKLETKLFEPRDAACTPPLRRKVFRKSTSSERDEMDGPGRRGRMMKKFDSEEASSSDEAGANEMVTDLQKMVLQLRTKAKASSKAAVKQLAKMQNSSIGDGEEVTVRQLAQLQHKNTGFLSNQPNVVTCC